MIRSSGAMESGMNYVAREVLKNCPHEEGDYVGDDGLLYCGKCHTPKTCKVKWPFSKDDHPAEKIFPIMCKCSREKKEQEEALRAKLKEMEEIRRLKISSLMDDKFKDSTFDAFCVTKHNAKQLKLCKRYAEKFDELYQKNQGLLLWGGVGTGKTYMAACISNYLMDRLVPVVMTSFVKILQNVQTFRDEKAEEEYIRNLNIAKLLVIDDLGAERGTDYAVEKVYNIIDSRYRAGKPMILTTNLTLSQMQNASDIGHARIYDRVFEVCYPIKFEGESWRKQEAADRFEEMTRLLEGDE